MATTTSRGRWQLLGMQASGFVKEKYKQARLALGDVTAAELLVQEATNCNGGDLQGPDARTLACIADAAFDMDDYWRIAGVLRGRMARAGDWKEWRPVYKALVVLEFLLTHGPPGDDDLSDIAAQLCHLRGFTHVDDTGFDWGACMQSRCDTVLALLERRGRRANIRVSHHGGGGGGGGGFSPLASGSAASSDSPSSASSRTSSSHTTSTWSVASSDSPTMVCLCAASDYRHDKKFDAYMADDDDDWMMHHHLQQALHSSNTNTDDGWEDSHEKADSQLLPRRRTGPSSSSASFCSRMLVSVTSRASGFQSLSQPERRAGSKKLQRQLSMDY